MPAPPDQRAEKRTRPLVASRVSPAVEADELSEAELDELKLALTSAREQVEASLASFEDAARPVDLDTPIGRLSRMDAIQQQKMSQANRDQAKRRLLQIDAALAAFDDEVYGLCRRCEEPIGIRRLRARPESSRCLECQGQSEQR